jgi:hypothetical protein
MCGNPVLSARDVGEDDWRLLGEALLEGEMEPDARPERSREGSRSGRS